MTETGRVDGGGRAGGRRRAPAGLLGALLLGVAVEAIVGQVDDDRFTTVGASAWSYASSSARRLAAGVGEGPGVVAMGDSLVKHGVIPAVLRGRLGRPSHNLAMPWGQAAGSDFLLRRLLRAGARPDALLVDGEMLCEDPGRWTRVWPELIGLGESAELAMTARDPRLFAKLALGGLMPSYRARHEIRAAASALIEGAEPPDRFAVPVHRLNWRRNQGAEPLPEGRAPEVPGEARADWACHPANARFVERLLDRAGAEAIPVYWLLPPYHPDVQALRERSGWDASYEAFVRDLAARHPHVTVVDARHAGYPPEAMADLTHLNRRGAVAFTAALADVLDDRLRPEGVAPVADRWVRLPPWDAGRFDEVRAVVAVEDVVESAEAFRRR